MTEYELLIDSSFFYCDFHVSTKVYFYGQDI